jgi:hypothetical protein
MHTIEIYNRNGSLYASFTKTTRTAALAELRRWTNGGWKAAIL